MGGYQIGSMVLIIEDERKYYKDLFRYSMGEALINIQYNLLINNTQFIDWAKEIPNIQFNKKLEFGDAPSYTFDLKKGAKFESYGMKESESLISLNSYDTPIPELFENITNQITNKMEDSMDNSIFRIMLPQFMSPLNYNQVIIYRYLL